MKLSIISDTHNKHKRLRNFPKADVLIHCGDISSMGYEHEIKNFVKWFGSLEQFKYKIFIAGNHDFLFEKNNVLARQLIPDNIIYLEDQEVIIDNIKFYGTPVQKHFHNWAFNRSENKMKQHWEAIPDDTDVLITHSPPYMIGDYVPYSMQHEGSPSLYEEVTERIKPSIHAMGHIHEGYGQWEIGETKFINASSLDGDYMAVNPPVVVEI